MKRITLLSAAAICIFAAVSCNPKEGPEATSTVISVNLPQGGAMPKLWAEHDLISVNGVVSAELNAAAAGQSTASFTFDQVLATPYYAAAPSVAVSGFNAGSASLTIPASQNYVAGSYDPAAYVLYGKSEVKGAINLKPAVSIFHLSLTGSASISKIRLSGEEGTALSGSYTTDFEELTAANVSNSVELAPASPVALPADFYICVPAGLSGEISVKVFATDDSSMHSSVTIGSALAPGQMYQNETPVEYVPNFDIDAEGITSSTAVIYWAGAFESAYTIRVFADKDCATLVDTYAIPAGDPCWSEKSPRFCIGGLKANTTYYVRVTDESKPEDSNVLPVTTLPFTVVEVSNTPASVGDVILAEDFSELRWDCDMIGNGAGYFPVSQDSFSASEAASYQAAATSNEKMLSKQSTAIAASRLAHWAQGANANMYIHPGYIKLVGSKKVTHLVTPALSNIPAGKLAVLSVELTASAYYSESSASYATTSAIVAVQPSGAYNELVDDGTNTLDLTSNVSPITLSEETAWNTYQVVINGVSKGDRLAFGADSEITENNARMNISDMKVTVLALIDNPSVMMIRNEADFNTFVAALAAPEADKAIDAILAPENGNELVISEATAATFKCIDDYAGTFDGDGNTISGLPEPMFSTMKGTVKNLTVKSNLEIKDSEKVVWGILAKTLYSDEEVAGVASIVNCKSQGSITYTPDAAMSSDLRMGGLIGDNRGGIIQGCSNEATVIFADNGEVNASQSSVGGVIGRTQAQGDYHGSISGCSNTGDVICNAAMSANLYIGGVLGYGVEKAESISGCTNGGLVKAGASCKTNSAALHIGGVIGMTKGTASSCTNNGTVTTEDGSIAGTYLCQGGVVGRLNRDAAYDYSGHSNAGDINVGASGSSSGVYIGGIVGRLNEGASISSCENTGGTINYSATNSKCELLIGGIVGVTNKPVTSCTNATAINAAGTYSLNSSGKYYSVGGIVGYQKGDEELKDDVNTADITLSATSTGYTALGGIVGYTQGVVTGGSNSGTVTFSGSSNTQNIPIGGIAARTPSGKSGARISGAVNNGAVVINTSTQTKKTVYVGGIVGHHQSGDLIATNNGNLTVTNITCTNLQIGGVAGNSAGAISASQNTGKLSIEGLKSQQHSYVAGVAAYLTSSISESNNTGDVVITDGSYCKYSFFVGGVVGRAQGAISACNNSGLISNAAPITTDTKYYMQIGGIVGYNNGDAPIDGCQNTGAVSNTANCTGYLYVGGITSESDAKISGCSNTGNVSNTGNSGNGHPICVGGITGVASADVENSSNGTATAQGGTISNSGNSAEDVCIGGVVGWNNNKKLTACFNKADVTNSGNGGYIAVGGVVGWSSASSTYEGAITSTGNITNTGTASTQAYTGNEIGHQD